MLNAFFLSIQHMQRKAKTYLYFSLLQATKTLLIPMAFAACLLWVGQSAAAFFKHMGWEVQDDEEEEQEKNKKKEEVNEQQECVPNFGLPCSCTVQNCFAVTHRLHK